MQKYKNSVCHYLWMEAVVQRCFMKKGILENFAKFTGKHLCQSLFFNKVSFLSDEKLQKFLKKVIFKFLEFSMKINHWG